jgi:hypothetical protein
LRRLLRRRAGPHPPPWLVDPSAHPPKEKNGRCPNSSSTRTRRAATPANTT